jgi:protein-disulfide isomerase
MQNGIKIAIAVVAGAAVGGLIVSQDMLGKQSGGIDKAAVEQIVRDVISNEPKLILDSVNNLQNKERQAQAEQASEALKDDAVRLGLFNNTFSPFVGPADSKHVVVEFFDYNCPACKMQFAELEKIIAQNKGVKIIFKEFPIFGEQSDQNARIALAVHRVAPEKYFDFHAAMMRLEGRADEAAAMNIVRDIGLDVSKVSKELETNRDEINATLKTNRTLGDTLKVRGTPTIVVGDTVIPHAEQADGIIRRLGL